MLSFIYKHKANNDVCVREERQGRGDGDGGGGGGGGGGEVKPR